MYQVHNPLPDSILRVITPSGMIKGDFFVASHGRIAYWLHNPTTSEIETELAECPKGFEVFADFGETSLKVEEVIHDEEVGDAVALVEGDDFVFLFH